MPFKIDLLKVLSFIFSCRIKLQIRNSSKGRWTKEEIMIRKLLLAALLTAAATTTAVTSSFAAEKSESVTLAVETGILKAGRVL